MKSHEVAAGKPQLGDDKILGKTGLELIAECDAAIQAGDRDRALRFGWAVDVLSSLTSVPRYRVSSHERRRVSALTMSASGPDMESSMDVRMGIMREVGLGDDLYGMYDDDEDDEDDDEADSTCPYIQEIMVNKMMPMQYHNAAAEAGGFEGDYDPNFNLWDEDDPGAAAFERREKNQDAVRKMGCDARGGVFVSQYAEEKDGWDKQDWSDFVAGLEALGVKPKYVCGQIDTFQEVPDVLGLEGGGHEEGSKKNGGDGAAGGGGGNKTTGGGKKKRKKKGGRR